ncbi:MAG: hypothetical protein ACR2LC_11050 [Pyrinomonadaceae bacterium]
MSHFEDFKQYLPKYLSPDAQANLFNDIKDFPENLKRLYTEVLASKGDVFQGDGLKEVLIIKLPDTTIRKGPAMVISNTCDTSFSNARLLSPKIAYCPIVKLSNYITLLRRNSIPESRIDTHIKEIRKQWITSIFFLPKGGSLPEDCVVLLDNLNSCDVGYLSPESVISLRLFSLSNYGFYVFLFKLAVHLTRIRESEDRG